MILTSIFNQTQIFSEVIDPTMNSSDDMNFNDISNWGHNSFVKAKLLLFPYLDPTAIFDLESITTAKYDENDLYRLFFDSFKSYAGESITNYMLNSLKGTSRVIQTQPNSDLSRAVANSTNFIQAFHNKYKPAIEEVIKENYYYYNPTGVERSNTPFEIPLEDFQNKIQSKWIRFNWSVFNTDFIAKYNNSDTACTAAIGGYKGLQIFISEFNVSDQYPLNLIEYSGKLTFVIADNFGVGANDIYSPSLAAMYLLQHGYSGYTPFRHFIIVEKNIEGRISIPVVDSPRREVTIEL